jgi:hypothetical protein
VLDQAGLWKQPRSTVRMALTAPGEVAEMDFGKLGTLINPVTSKRQVVWGLLVIASTIGADSQTTSYVRRQRR